jgi:hypothetical protein
MVAISKIYCPKFYIIYSPIEEITSQFVEHITSLIFDSRFYGWKPARLGVILQFENDMWLVGTEVCR